MLKSLEWREPIKASLSLDGRYIAYDAPAGESGSARDIFMLAEDGSRETLVEHNPANDRSPVWSPDGSRIVFLSDRTGNASLWMVPLVGGRPTGPAELAKADIGTIDPLGHDAKRRPLLRF